MLDSQFLLTDEQMLQFVTKGYLVLRNELPEPFHRRVMDRIYHVLHEEGNPGNNILPRVPDIQQFFDTPVVRGALTSVLGPDYYMHPHRHCHYNRPGNQTPGGGQWHKDGYWSSMRSHRPWWAMIFYYTQDITEELGPTAVMPGTQYYEKFIGDRGETLLPTGKAGTMVLVHFDLWHKASINVSNLDRYMLKFQFVRLRAPEAPSWNHRGSELVVPDGTPALHLNLWRDVWDWLRGERPAPEDRSALRDPETLLAELSAEDAETRGRAADELGLIGEAAGSAAAELAKRVGDETETTALNAAYALGSMGSEGAAQLLRLMTEGTHLIAERSAYGLQRAGAAAVPGLIGLLRHDDEKRRALAAFVLGMAGPAAGAEAVAALIAASRGDGSEWVRRNAVEALGMIGNGSGLVVPELAAALTEAVANETEAPAQSGDMYISKQNYIVNKIGYTAALSLLRTGRDGETATVIAALEQALLSKDRYVRAYAAEALTHLRTPEAVDVLIRHYRAARWCPDTHKASAF
ncbi:MAG: HEAT repeat domain-containing protein [Paenibacillaceae bacterium]|nr:HEAT repeat domain-containing protein [Paenibacillaceae bacterium]